MNTRDRLLLALDGPRCARELAERTGIGRKTVVTCLLRMARSGWVKCVTPAVRQARLFDRTPAGDLLVLAAGHAQAKATLHAALLPKYAWVQAGAHRRAVLKHFSMQDTPQGIRKRLLTEHVRMTSDHVRDTLQELQAQDLAVRFGRLWAITAQGEALQKHARTPSPPRQ